VDKQMQPLSKNIVNKLIKKKLKISFAESCTGGLLSSAITSVSGSSKVFTLGLVAYSNQSKIKVLKVPKNIIRKYGSVSAPVCLAMVKNLSKISKTNISVSVTGIAGPSGGTKIKPVGLVYVGIKKGNRTEVKKYLFKNKGRSYIQKTAVNKSLGLILSFLK
jgi:PncC family amidohydrolase